MARANRGTTIRWRENGRRRSAKFPSEDIASRVLAKIVGDIAAGHGGLKVERPPAPPLVELAVDWLERWKTTHRSHRDDASRWGLHLKPFFGHQRPEEVTPADIRRFAELKLAEGLSSTTVGHAVRLLSTFFTDLVERGLAPTNPVRAVPRATRRLYRNARTGDIRSVFLALPSPINVAFAVGALAGLRTGEVLGLAWENVDLEGRCIMVRQLALEGCSLPPVSWYGCTRHAFASHFVLGGGSIERLRVIMGHESVTTTERYAHLSPSNYGARELGAVVVDLSPATGKVIPLSRAVSGAADHGVTTDAEMEVARTAATS